MAILDGISDSSALSGGKAAASQAKMEEDFNQFLNLLVTQLKNQDPLDPMDSNEFTNQLVQFASVEQEIQTNANLEKILQVNEYSHMGSMVGYIGKSIEASGTSMPVEDGEGNMTYELSGNAASATLTIRNDSGKVVFFTDAETSPGKHAFTWDGKDNYGMPLDDGTYTVNVAAQDPYGELMEVNHTIIGRVTGVQIEDGQASLEMSSGLDVDFEDVISVKDSPQVVN